MKKFFPIIKLTLAVLLVMGLNSQSLNAQIIESFEDDCADLGNSFALGCIPDWIAVSGSPDTRSVEEPAMDNIPVPHEERYARLYTGFQSCYNGNTPIAESIALNHSFKKCTDYTLSFRMKQRTFDPGGFHGQEYDAQIRVLLANGFENVPPPDSNCAYIAPTITSEMEVLRTYTFTNGETPWQIYQFSFTPEDDFSQLAFIPQFLDNVTQGVYFFIDYVILIDGDSPQYPDFYLTDEDDGTPKTEICYGKDVWVCLGSANVNWINTQFTIYKEPAGSFYSKTGTVFGVDKNGCYNLSQFIRNRGNALFKANQSYEVKMAIQHPDCGWIDSYYPIEIICCEEELDPSFTFDLQTQGDTYGITASANTDYSEIEGVHEFCLEVDTDGDGFIDDTDCHFSNSFSAEDLNPEYTYYIDHCVETPCDIDCEKVKIEHCFKCEEECEVSGFNCLRNEKDSYLSWASSSNVNSFEIEVLVNDPACGCKGIPRRVDLSTTDTYIRVSPPFGCFSFKVRPICEVELPNGEVVEYGEWSNSFCPSCNDLESLVEKESNPRAAFDNPLDKVTPAIYPNPFQNEINFQLDEFPPTGVRLEIYTTTGELIFYQQRYRNGIIDLSHISYQGLLLVKVFDGENTFHRKMLCIGRN